MNSRQIGVKHQAKSVQYILKNYNKYGIKPEYETLKSGKLKMTSERIFNVRVGQFQPDLFGRFDIITMPEKGHSYLIQVKSKSFSLSLTKDLEYFNWLCEFSVPDGIIKELHIWSDISNKPQIIEC